MERKKSLQRSILKIVERGDWLKIEIFLFKNISRPFVSWRNWSENFDQRLRRKKIGPIRDGDLLLAKARRTVPVQYREKEERETIGECFEFMRSVQ